MLNKNILWLIVFAVLSNSGFINAQDTQKSSTVKKVATVMSGVSKLVVGVFVSHVFISKIHDQWKYSDGLSDFMGRKWKEGNTAVFAGAWMLGSGIFDIYSFVKEQFFTQEEPVSEFRVVNE